MPDTPKKTANRQAKRFRLHYFPDIPVDNPAVDPDCVAAEESSFKRICFEPVGSSCAQARESMAEPDSAGHQPAAAEVEEQAFQKGFQEGHKTGIESQRAQIVSAGKALEQTIVHIQNLGTQIYDTIEQEVVELALAIARKVVCREVEGNREIVVCVAKEALSRVEVPGEIKIRLNPADLEFIKETEDQISTLLEHADKVTFEAEASISRGGCVIETNLGEIDARIENQLRVVEEMFRAEMAKSEPKENGDQPS